MVVPLIVLLCLTFGCQRQVKEVSEEPAVDVEADVAAIKALNDEWVQLYNAGDFDGLMSIFYTENSILMSPNESIRKGKEAILLLYQKASELDDEHVDSSVVEDVRVSGDLAVARGTDIGTTTPKVGGESIRFNIKWVIAYERQSDGTWKCVYEIWNDNDPIPAPPEQE